MSTDEIRNGRVWKGFDYRLQVWVVEGVIQDCNHPKRMKEKGCCKGHRLRGRNILEVSGAEIRENPGDRQ